MKRGRTTKVLLESLPENILVAPFDTCAARAAHFGDRDRSFRDRDRRSLLGRVADQAIVTKIVALIEQRSALTARRLLDGGPETEEQDTDES